MAWIEKRPKGYLVRWREPSGKVVSARRRTRIEARELKASMDSSILRGTYVQKETRQLPFGEYAKLVLDSDASLAPRTRENYERCLRLQLKELFFIPIEQVDAGRVRTQFSMLREENTSDHVLHMTKKTLSKVCSVAVEEGILPRNPAKSVKVKKPDRREVEPSTPEEVAAAAAAVPPRWKAAVLLGGWGGLRISEVGGLTRDDVDWDRGAVRIRQGKTKASRRVVTLPDFVMKALREHMLAYSGESILFPTVNGNPINHHTIAPIMRKAGAPRFHDLRHTAVTILIAQGHDPLEIKERMGHSSISVTYDIYGHLFKRAHDELARTLEQFDPGEMGKVLKVGETG